MFFINLSTKNKILEKDYIKKEKKLIMEYEYVNENLLEFTQKYQKTSFYGNKFLKSYFENRIKIINSCGISKDPWVRKKSKMQYQYDVTYPG